MPKIVANVKGQEAQPGRIAKAAVPKWLVLRWLEQDILHHHATLSIGRSQVALQRPADVAEKLAVQRIATLRVDKQWLVQAKPLVQHLLCGGVHLTPVEIAIPWPTRCSVHQRERDKRHEEQHRDSPEQSADDILRHDTLLPLQSQYSFQTMLQSGRRRLGAGRFVVLSIPRWSSV